MSKGPVFQFGVFYALLCQCVFGFVPTNVSVVCHNFINTLYWNYSHPAEQPKFSVLIKPYESDSQTVDTSQTFLDISNYSSDPGDNYVVFVTAHDGQEKSESASIKFTYSKDFYYKDMHKCSLDFPDVNTSVHKDVIEVSFWHPSLFYEQYMEEWNTEEFKYTIAYDQKKSSYKCVVDDHDPNDHCSAKIYLNQSMAGHCVELKFEGEISAIPSYTYRNVCIPQLTPEPDNTGLFMALLGGGFLLFFITVGVVWLLWKKWSKIPKFPEVLQRIMIHRQSPSTLLSQSEQPPISSTATNGHKPLLVEVSDGSFSISPDEKDCEIITDLGNTEEPECPEGYGSEDSTGCSLPSDYNRPKFLHEIGPEDFAEGYGPRPPVI